MSKSTIAGVQFVLRDAQQIKDHSVVDITNYDMYTNNIPTQGGVFDPRMGTTLRELKCPVCKNSKGKCLGHIGHIDLAYPVINPFGIKDYKKWLKVVCHKCGNPVVAPMNKAGDKLTAAATVTRNKNRKCASCNAVHPIMKQSSVEKLALEAVFLDDNGMFVSKHTIFPHMAYDIFSRVTPESVELYGRLPENHPLTTILYTITAPSNIIRPDVRQTGNDQSNTNAVTNMLIVIIKKNDEFPNPIPEEITETLEKKVWAFNNLYFEMLRAGGKETTSIAGQFKSKNGLFRRALLGKMVRRIARSTIIGDPTLKLDEVRIPQKFAKIIYVEETVQDYNKHALLVLLQNNYTRYPGASAIIKKSGGTFDVNPHTDLTTLENGDIVCRDIIDGDYVYFNRQPSFMPSNMSGFRVVVSRDTEDLTIGMSVTICQMYNADFDGDAMNLIFASNAAGMSEIETVGWMGNNIVHFSSTKMLVGQRQDSVIGMAELTRDSILMDKFHACMLFARASEMPSLSKVFTAEKPKLTGRECMSLILEKTPIDIVSPATWYNPSFIPAIKYSPTEITTTIKNGVLVKGVLDKATLGDGAINSIYQVIANEHGNRKAIQSIFDMQQMAIHFMKMRGYTVTVQDMILPKEARLKIATVTAEAIARSKVITNQLIRRDILPPMGVTIRDHYEQLQINALTIYDEYVDILLQYVDHDNNNLFKIAAFGSKGNMENVANIVSAVGQKILDGRRMPKKFGFERTLPCFQRFDLNPDANGYIANSYIEGLNAAELGFSGMCSRWALIIKALASSVGGQMSREAIKSMESMTTNYFRHVMQGRGIITFVYGGDNLDPRKVEKLKLDTVTISDESLKDRYLNEDIPEEFERILDDRNKYRRVFMRLESTNTNEPFKDNRQLAVDIKRIMDRILGATGMDAQDNREDLLECASDIKKFCDELPYVYYNDDWRAAKLPVSNTVKDALWLMSMRIRIHLCTRELQRQHISRTQLGLILDRIRLNYTSALIDPGVAVGLLAAMGFSEPLMQQMMDAHRKSATGGNSLSGTKRAKEVFNIRDTIDMAAPEMILQFTSDISSNKVDIQKIANSLEVIRFEFLVFGQPLIFVEKYGKPVHSKYKHETELITEFESKNPLLTPPGDLLHFCIRYELDKTQLILKNMEMEYLVVMLRTTHPHLFIVYTSKNAPRVILRVYARASYYKTTPGKTEMEELDGIIQGTVLRGVTGIIRADPIKLVRHNILEDGSIAADSNRWGVKTTGTNIIEGLLIPGVIPEQIFSNSIMEIYELFGIEAARTVIINECRRMLASCNYRHYDTYASLITQKGYPTSITLAGTKKREPDNILLNMGFSHPADYLETAVTYGIYNEIGGISSSLAVGSLPRVGTNYTQMEINETFIRENASSANREFEELFDL
jgi:DNA-directed RNA polymerase II subunit RPB1